MDYLWTPWRYTYLATAAKAPSCIFCDLQRSDDDRKALIVHRATYNFIILNAYPYTSGHSMVVPYEHIGRLHEATASGRKRNDGAGATHGDSTLRGLPM